MSLAQRVALVTGASQGIGRTCALRFAKEGAAVAEAARKPAIRIIRKTEQGTHPFTADEDTALEPGDVVEVALRQDSAVAAAQ